MIPSFHAVFGLRHRDKSAKVIDYNDQVIRVREYLIFRGNPFSHVFSAQPKEAVHCRDGCSALRERLQCTASERGKTDTDVVSPILDKRKGRKGSP